MYKKISIIIVFFLPGLIATAQDSLILNKQAAVVNPASITSLKDSVPAKKYNPNIAIRRSAIVPGWGQYTNKKYWKIPVVYTALGTTAFLFVHNLNQFNDASDAYRLAVDNDPTNDYLIKEPYFSVKDQPSRIQSFRNEVRQNVDYSALFFILFWGLNVADAAVDAHFKTFDVNEDLSLQIKPGYSPVAKTNGVSLVLAFTR